MDQIRSELVEVEEKEEVTLPGFRFHPTDEELVGFYLRRKVEKKSIRMEIIKQVDIYKYDPWDLPISNLGDKEWYFFCLRGRKYRNSIRPNRVTGSGFWKATGIDRPIYAAGGGHGDCIGLKKSLVYYRGSAGKGTKTDWMMHEFRLPSDGSAGGKFNGVNHSCIPEGESWTICRIFKRTVSHKRCTQSQSSWKNSAPSTKQPTETCSAESNGDDDYQHLLASTFQHSDNNSVITCYEDYTVQFNDTNSGSVSTQPPSAASHSNAPSSNPNEFFFKEGSWDELGRVVEFSVDPFLLYECRY